MKRITLIIGFVLQALLLQAQRDTAIRLVRTLPLQATDFAVDPLDNLYIVTANNTLKKFNANGDSSGVFNDVRRFGRLHAIDVSNPLKLLLFYKEFSTIAILDRFLALKGVADLKRMNMVQVSAVGSSYDNHIWLFDALENKLKKVDDNGKLLLETVDWRQLFNTTIVPQTIVDQDQWVYLYDPKAGLYVFDHYGTFRRKYDIFDWNALHIRNGIFTGIVTNGLRRMDAQRYPLLQEYQFPSSFGSFDRYLVGNTQLFTIAKDSVSIYMLPGSLRRK